MAQQEIPASPLIEDAPFVLPARVSAALEKREQDVTARENAARAREKTLFQSGEILKRQIADLASAERAVKSILSLAEAAAEQDLQRLTAVYENMRPKEAAALFENMDPEFSAGFIARMRAEAAASVLAKMSAERAYAVSVVVAGKNARPAVN